MIEKQKPTSLEVVDSDSSRFSRRGRGGPRDETPTITEVVRALIDERWTVAAVALGVLALAVAYLFVTTPVYEASALIQVTNHRPLTAIEEFSEMFGETSPAETEMEILRSGKILGPVVNELGLDVEIRADRAPVIGTAFARRHGSGAPAPALFGLAQYAWGGERIQVKQLQVSEALLNQPLRLTALEGDRYRLLAGDGATLLEGKVGELAAAEQGDRKIELLVADLVARPGSSFIVIRRSTAGAVDALRDSLVVAEKGRRTGVVVVRLQGEDPARIARILEAITQTYLTHNVARLSSEAAATLGFVEQQLPAQKARLEKAEAAYRTFQVRKGTVLLGEETRNIVVRSGEVERQLSEVQLQMAETLARVNDQHPDARALLERAKGLEGVRAQIESRMRELPVTEVEAARLAREVNVATELYTLLLRKAQELRIIKSGVVGNATVLDPPTVPQWPVKPTTSVVLISGLLLGLLLGLGAAIVRRLMDDGADDPEQIEDSTGLPIFVAVPHSAREARASRRAGRTGPKPLPALAREAPDDAAVETLRTLRTAVESALSRARNDIVAIVAPSRDMGKTFVTANLGHLLAGSGKRVLLVDADLRGGRLHRYFSLDRGPGLSEHMGGTAPLDAVLRSTGVHGLDLLSTGAIPANPAELLASKRFEGLLNAVASRYDVVLVDTAPVLSVTDAVVVARYAGVNVLVLRPARHETKDVRLTLKRFAHADVRLNGIVLNAVRGAGLRYQPYAGEEKDKAQVAVSS